MIPKGMKTNFETLQKAFANGDVCLLEVKDSKTGEPRFVICAVQRDTNGFEMVPFAEMPMANPYDIYTFEAAA